MHGDIGVDEFVLSRNPNIGPDRSLYVDHETFPEVGF
jgi:hypothetical protein